ncbi:outer membrane protein assembly factor BamD [Marinicella sp. S1101]|uniref:outer membrane protein assembly factor BamD n=1 Tax=Marinicella marina TaxID=2996016 RepID=UPI002260B044|nr:outer membrane protein assembly factor BamD [Marinicella marina]MCX7552685.1 outer membrane protein assembly factor BamD [Marinicella marina]MDJ1139561.1 outer membrane protein assembly factor BamD [Marinicella marina]
MEKIGIDMLHNNKTHWAKLCLLIILSVAVLQGCGKKDEIREVEVTKLSDLEMYLAGKRALDAGAWSTAALKYKALRSHYPFGHYTEQGSLELAYAQYKMYQMEQAISSVDRFIKNYPAHKNLDYAYYLKGLIYFDSDRGLMQRINPDKSADRNQENVRNAFTAFRNFIERYPESSYAPDAQKRMIHLKNKLAAYEVQVARYYLRRGAPIAAVNRAKFVLESFQDTPAVPHALALMVESYKKLNEDELAMQSEEMLAANFPNHNYLSEGKLDLSTDVLEWKDIWPF